MIGELYILLHSVQFSESVNVIQSVDIHVGAVYVHVSPAQSIVCRD